MMLKDTTNVAVGDAWIYTTPSGKHIRYTVTATDVESKHQYRPGPCIKLVARAADGVDCIMWAEDLGKRYWSKA